MCAQLRRAYDLPGGPFDAKESNGNNHVSDGGKSKDLSHCCYCRYPVRKCSQQKNKFEKYCGYRRYGKDHISTNKGYDFGCKITSRSPSIKGLLLFLTRSLCSLKQEFIDGLFDSAFVKASERPPKEAKPLTTEEKLTKAYRITEDDEEYANNFASNFSEIVSKSLDEYKTNFMAAPGQRVPFNDRHEAGLQGIKRKLESRNDDILCAFKDYMTQVMLKEEEEEDGEKGQGGDASARNLKERNFKEGSEVLERFTKIAFDSVFGDKQGKYGVLFEAVKRFDTLGFHKNEKPEMTRDRDQKFCSFCDRKFTWGKATMTRVWRHHCRGCGKLACDMCTTRRVLLPHWSKKVEQRVCDSCYYAAGQEESDRDSKASQADAESGVFSMIGKVRAFDFASLEEKITSKVTKKIMKDAVVYLKPDRKTAMAAYMAMK